MRKGEYNAFTSPLPANRFYSDEANYDGLNKREYFAGLAMQGLVTKYNLKEPSDQSTITQMAVELADELIKALNK